MVGQIPDPRQFLALTAQCEFCRGEMSAVWTLTGSARVCLSHCESVSSPVKWDEDSLSQGKLGSDEIANNLYISAVSSSTGSLLVGAA